MNSAACSTRMATDTPESGSVASVSVVEFTEPGISVLPYTTSFSSLAKTANFSNGRDALLPYSAVIRNGTPHSIIAYTMSWSTAGGAGTKPCTEYRTVCATEDPASQIGANADKLVSIVNSPLETVDIKEHLERFSHSELSVALEAVMFEDGSTAGRDASASMAQVKANVKSEYDLFRSILGTDQSSVTALLKQRAESLKPGSTLDLTDPFGGWFRYYQARNALRLLKMTDTDGISETVAFVQNTLQTKRYPAKLETWGGQ